MGQCDEMTDQGTRQDDGRTEQQVIILREKGQENQNHNVEEHDAIIELSRTDLVIVARPQEMDDACDGEDDQEGIGEIVGEGDATVSGEECDFCERTEMVDKHREVALVKDNHCRNPNPIGCEYA